MIYVDINVAKQAHFASLISSDDEILVELFQFSNGGDVLPMSTMFVYLQSALYFFYEER